MLVLKNSRVISELTPNFQGEAADIFIEGQKIAKILPSNSYEMPAEWQNAQIIDMTGKTVMPGLIEGHLHLDLSGMDTFEENVMPGTYRVVRALKLAQDNLRQGYTTVRDVGDRDNIILDLARAIREGLVVGPDILASGKIITPTEKGNNFFGAMYSEGDSPMEFRRNVRKQYQLGADFIKIMATGAVMNPGGEPGSSIVMEDELKSICETAKSLNLYVAAHCHGTEAIKMCIRNGVRTIEHSSIMDDEAIEMYKNSTQSFMMPTMAPMTNFLEFSEGRPAHYIEKARKIKDAMVEGMKKACAAGLKIGWATDAGVYEGSHGDGIYEFRARVRDAGFTPLECLIQATKNNAEILMIDSEVGTLEVGKKANILCCAGNPDQDIEDLTKVAMVIKSGSIVNI